MFAFFTRIGFPLAFMLALLAAPLSNATAQGLTPTMEEEVKALIEDYISDNPEILIDAIRSLREKEIQKRHADAKGKLYKNRDALKNSPFSPVGGNPKGDITVVEFSDYRCPFCKRMAPVLKKLLEEDGNVRVVYKEFPILGTVSTYAAKATLAAWYTRPEKYEDFHNAILGARGDLTEERVLSIAEDVGLDSDAIGKAMLRPEINQEIERNLKLAADLNITGTPTYIIGKELVPGAISYEDLKNLVAEARKPSKPPTQ